MNDHADELNKQARAWKSTVLAMSAEDHLERAATHLANADMCRTALREEEDKSSPSGTQLERLRSSESVFLQRAQIHAAMATARQEHTSSSSFEDAFRYPQPFLA